MKRDVLGLKKGHVLGLKKANVRLLNTLQVAQRSVGRCSGAHLDPEQIDRGSLESQLKQKIDAEPSRWVLGIAKAVLETINEKTV